MQVHTNTDNHLEGREALALHVEQVVRATLRHAQEHVTRVEVHLADENGARSSDDDKRCMMEARLKGRPPLAVSHHAGSVHQALDGAARKLRAAVDSTLGRLSEHHRHPAPQSPE
jgi:ribosome-associated translation inhibitor RaiA